MTHGLKSLMLAMVVATTGFAPTSAPANSAVHGGEDRGTLQRAWDAYYATLRDLQQQVERSERFNTHSENRAKAYHVLMEAQALTFNLAIAPRMANPRILKALSYQTDIYATGLPGPDFVYGAVLLDGRQTYRLTGRVGDTKLFVAQAWAGLWGEPSAATSTSYDLLEMDRRSDGTFSVMIGGSPQSRNWIPLDPQSDYQTVVFRRQISDWTDDIGDLKIERISPIADDHYDYDEFDADQMTRRITRAQQYLKFLGNYIIGLYDVTFEECGRQINVFCTWSDAGKARMAGTGLANYTASVFEIGDDDALIIEMDAKPDARYWSFQLGDVWGRSLPFQERQASLNMEQAVADADGRVRIILSKRDPGVANWLDPCGRATGLVLYRNYFSGQTTLPTIRRVPVAELPNILPTQTKRISREERAAALTARRASIVHVMDE